MRGGRAGRYGTTAISTAGPITRHLPSDRLVAVGVLRLVHPSPYVAVDDHPPRVGVGLDVKVAEEDAMAETVTIDLVSVSLSLEDWLHVRAMEVGRHITRRPGRIRREATKSSAGTAVRPVDGRRAAIVPVTG